MSDDPEPRFRVELKGDVAALRALAPHFQSSEVRLHDEGDLVFLTSSTFKTMTTRAEVFEAAERILSALPGAMRIAGVPISEPVIAQRVFERTPDGQQNTTFISIPSIAMVMSMPAPTILIDGKPPPPPPAIPVERALHDARVARALELFGRDPNWFDLYKVLDTIEEDVGGERALEDKGWATRAELKRFTRTANNLNALGSGARHAIEAWQPPKNPMSLEEASVLIGKVLAAWMATK